MTLSVSNMDDILTNLPEAYYLHRSQYGGFGGQRGMLCIAIYVQDR